MFQFIRKHQAIGLIFIGIVIVSFVIFFSPNQRGGRGAGLRRGALGTIHGRPIEREEYIVAGQEARLAQFLRDGGRWPGRDWDEQQQRITRLFLLDEADRLGIKASDEVVANHIVELPFLQDEKTGTFNRAAYDQFLSVIARESGISPTGFELFMRHEVILQQLAQIGGLSGTLIPPREAEARFRAANQHFAAQLVAFSATNYLAEVNLDPTNVARFYTNRMAEYRIPERVQVRYVKFASTNFMAEADQQLNSNTNLARGLEAEYQKRGPNSFQDAQGNPMTPEDAKAELKEQFRHGMALEAARKQAVEFANRLYRLEANVNSLNQLATEFGVPVQTSLPFDQFRPPRDMKVPRRTFNRVAFDLSAEQPFATPVVGEDGVYVFGFERRIPAEYQPLELVRDRVVDSLRRTESRNNADTIGRQFATTAKEALAAGKSFEAAAAEAGFKATTLTNFSRSTPSVPEVGPLLTVAELLRTAETLEVSKVSGFNPAGDGGYVMYLTARIPMPDDEMKKALPEFTKQAQQYGRFAAFYEWQRKRLAMADVRLPGKGGGATNSVPIESN